jgi:CubicO group peptidase (beta-lactamase class C family)
MSTTINPTLAIDGVCQPGFEAVADAFVENFRSRGDVGAAATVIVDGLTAVDLWGGLAAPGMRWQRDTIVNVWSSTKAVVALAAHMLADRAQLDLDAPVATYWPEFAAAGGRGAQAPGHYRPARRSWSRTSPTRSGRRSKSLWPRHDRRPRTGRGR